MQSCLKKEVSVSMSLEEQVKKIVSERLGVDLIKVVDDAHFVDDLGADSLDQVELVMELESVFGCEIPDAAVQKITTVRAAIDLIKNYQGMA